MAANVTNQNKMTQLLRRVLQADGVVVGLSGILLTAGVGPVSSLLGLNSPPVLVVMGLIFLVYGGAVLWVVTKRELVRPLGYAVALLNTIWVLASLAILLTDLASLTTQGKWIVAIVAVVVAAFAAVQYYALFAVKR